MRSKLFKAAILASVILGIAKPGTTLANNAFCREFTQTFLIAGSMQRGYGTACLQPDGSWKIVSQDDAKQRPKETTMQYIVKEDKNVYIIPKSAVIAPAHNLHHKSYRGSRRYHHF